MTILYNVPVNVPTGATMPTSPVEGSMFLQDTTGRKILYQYDGSSWQGLVAYGAITVYVDPTGTDDMNHGTATGTDAFQTINYARSILPLQIIGPAGTPANIYCSAGTFSENLTWGATIPTSIYGTYSTVASGLVATGGTQGTSGTATTPSITGTFTADEYTNYLVQFTSGANNGLYAVVGQTTTTTLYLLGPDLPAAPASGDTYDILGWDTILDGYVDYRDTPPSNSTQTTYTKAPLNLKGMKFSGNYASSQSVVYFNETRLALNECYMTIPGGSVPYGVYGDHLAAIGTLNTCVFNMTAAYGQIIKMSSGQIDVIGSRLIGTNTGSISSVGIYAEDNGLVAVYEDCEFVGLGAATKTRFGAHVNFYKQTTTPTSFIHGCGYTYYLLASSYVDMTGSQNVTLGTNLDGSTDANVNSSSVETASYCVLNGSNS